MPRFHVWIGLPMVLSACSSSAPRPADAPPPASDAGADDTDAAPPYAPPQVILDRPYTVYAPKGYDASKPAPLVLAFHGYGDGDDARTVEAYFQLIPVAEKETFLYIRPEGTFDKDKQRFWNGTDACCDFYGAKPDDVGYVRAILDDVVHAYNVDSKRIYVTGISAGGVFAHRLACDLADRVAAVVSLSGTTWKDPAKCAPAAPLAIVEVHSDGDQTVLYAGGTSESGGVYPSAQETVAHWATYDGCPGSLTDTGQRLDLDYKIAGAETKVEKYDACAHGDVELWTLQGGPHAPHLSASAWGETIWGYFAAHPKP